MSPGEVAAAVQEHLLTKLELGEGAWRRSLETELGVAAASQDREGTAFLDSAVSLRTFIFRGPINLETGQPQYGENLGLG
jgi:hypothetical protein